MTPDPGREGGSGVVVADRIAGELGVRGGEAPIVGCLIELLPWRELTPTLPGFDPPRSGIRLQQVKVVMMSADDPRRDVQAQEIDTEPLDVEPTPGAMDPPPVVEAARRGEASSPTFIGPRTHQRRGVESILVRVVATSGIVGICVALAAILGTQDVAFWIVGLAVSLVSVSMAAILWSSRTL
jgi:hypothetical protein